MMYHEPVQRIRKAHWVLTLGVFLVVASAVWVYQDRTSPRLSGEGPPAERIVLPLGKGESLEMVLVPAGTFLMGSPPTEEGRNEDEGPRREVTISKPFYMGVTEVTQGQWVAVMGTRPWSRPRALSKEDPGNAASYIGWKGAVAFCRKLSWKVRRKVKLPSEAQWEYACRAGSKGRFCFGDDESILGEYAWYEENSWDLGKEYAQEAGSWKPNAFGLRGMHGNVGEWCEDYYRESYAGLPKVDPVCRNPEVLLWPVTRGGSMLLGPKDCRSATRNMGPGTGSYTTGFRVIIVLE